MELRYVYFLGPIFWLSASAPAAGQASSPQADGTSPKAYTYTEQLPVFPAREAADSTRNTYQRLKRFLEQENIFPPKALRDGVQGQVRFSFTVDAQGRTTDIKLVQGLRADVDSAVLRNAHRLEAIRWQPGTQNGRPVGVLMTVPMSFRVSANSGAASSSDSLDAPRFHKARLPLSLWSLRHPVPSRKGIIYGSCVPRLGYDSGGRGQYVRVANVATGEVFRLPVKPAFHLQREDAFYFELPSGRYALIEYELAQPPERLARRSAGPGHSVAATRYIFAVEAGQLHYVGTWNLARAHEPHFLDEKAALDALLQPESQALHFDTAHRAIPQ